MTAEEYLRKLMREKAERQSISPVSVNTETPENVLRGYLSAIEAPKSAPVQSVKVQPPTTIPKTQIQTPVVTKKDYFKDSQVNAEANKTPTTSKAWTGDFSKPVVQPDTDKETVKKGIAADWKNIWDGVAQRFLGTASMFFTNPVSNSANNQLLGGIGGKIAEVTTGDKTASYQGASEQAYNELKAEQLTPEYKKEQENRQAAIDKAAKIVDDWAEKNKVTSTLSAGAGGLEQGTKNLVKGLGGALYKDELFGIKTYDSGGVLSSGYQQSAQDNKGLEKLLGDLTYSMGNMAPTMLIGSIAGSPGLGALLMGVGSAQGNYEDKRRQYADTMPSNEAHNKALIYGVLTGASEGALQYFIGSIPGISTKSAGGSLIKSPIARKLVSVIDDVFKLSSKSPVVQGLVKTAINSAVDISGEALEEGLQEYVYAGLNRLLFDEKQNYFGKGGLLETSAYSAFLGALTAGILGVPGNISTNSIFKKEARSKELQAEVDKFQQRVREQVPVSEIAGAQTSKQGAQIETDSKFIAVYNDNLTRQIAEETDPTIKAGLQQALDEFNAMYIPAEISTKTPQINELPVGVQVDAPQALDTATQAEQSDTWLKQQSADMTEYVLQTGTKNKWMVYSNDKNYIVEGVDKEQVIRNYNDLIGEGEISNIEPLYDYRKRKLAESEAPTEQGVQATETQPIAQAQTTDNIFDLKLTQNTTEPMAVAELTADENNLVQMAKAKFNREVIITDSLPGNAEGMYDKGKIYVGRNADNVYYVFGHELTHSLEVGKDNQQAYNRLSRYVSDTVIGRKNMQAEIEATKQRYAEIKPDMTDGEAYTEVIAKATGKYLFTDADAIAKIVRTDRSLASKIVQFLRETATRLAGTKEQKAVLKAIDLYRAALKQANTTENGKTQFATARIKKDTSEQTKEGTIGTLTIKNKGKSTNIRVEIVDRQFYAPILYGEKYNYYKAKVLSIEGYPNTPTSNEGKIRPASGYVFDNVVETRRIGDILIAKDEEFTDNFVPNSSEKYSIPDLSAMYKENSYRKEKEYVDAEQKFELYKGGIEKIYADAKKAGTNVPDEQWDTVNRLVFLKARAEDEMLKLSKKARSSERNETFSKMKKATKQDYKFFNTVTTGMSGFDRYLNEKDLSYMKSKGLTGYIVEMPPLEYIERTAKQVFKRENATYEDTIDLLMKQRFERKVIENYADMMNKGTRFDLPVMALGEGMNSQEGRHRAMAAYINGSNVIPVLLVQEIPKDGSEPKYSIPEDKAPKTQRDKDSEEVKKEKQQRLERLTTILLKYSDKYENGHDARVAEVDKLYSEGYKLVYGKNDSDISKSEPEPDKMQKVRDARGKTPGFIVSETNSNMYLSEEKITYKGKEYPRYRMDKYKEGKYRIYEADESTGSIRYKDRIIATDTTPTKAIKKLEVFINNSGMISRAWDKSERIDEYIKGQEKALQQYTDDYNSSTTDSAKSLYSDLIAKTKSEITRLKNEQSKLRQSAEPDKVYTEEKIPPIVETDESLPMKSTKRASRTAEGGTSEERARYESKKAEKPGKKSPEEVQAVIDKGIEDSGYKEPVTQEQLDNKQLIPNKITKDGKSVTVRGVFNTSLHMGLKNKETYPDIIDKTVNGNGTYTPESNKKTLDAAQKKIDRLGYDGALSEWEYKVVNDMRIRDIDVATAELLYKAAIEGGQGDIARKLLSEIAMIGTENGQAIQIISLFNKLNGEAHLITAQKIADRLNKQTEEQRKKQDKAPIEIPDNLAEKVRKAKTPAEKDAAFMEIKQDMYDQLPYGTWWERWNAWRYISMLGNFKTNIKNVGGNMGMLPLVAAKNLQLISMEKVANDKRLAQLKNIQAQMSKVKTTAELVELLGKANREDTGYVERLTQQLKDAGQLFEASILKTEMLNLNKRIEDGIGIYRTRAFHKSKAAHDFAVEDFKARAKSVMSGSSKYMGIPNSEFNDRRIFKFGLFEGARKLTNKPLEYGDKVFINRYYVNALASFLDANNVDIDAAKQAGEAIAKGETPADENAAKMVNLAREYATQEAREATFRDFSLITETIVEFRDAKTVATKHGTERTLKQSERIARRIAVDSVLPFIGTLVNITRRGAWEYNVGGLAKTILFDTNKVKTGEMSATTYLNNIAKGTTGSAVVLMGYLLGAAGIIVGRLPEDENEKDLAKTAGQQAYSLILGDHSYTIDWIAPFCIPLFLGVELSNLKKSGATQFKDYYQAGMNILSPLFELTLLKSVTDVVKAVKYENEPAQMFGVGASTLGLNYLAQGTPTLFGQISRTITKEQKTSVVDEGNPFTRDQQVFVQKIMGKLFMNQNKQDYVNMFGETKDTGNVAQRIATNFFLPWYSSKLKDDATIKGMISLEKEKTDGLGVNTIPKIPSASLPGVGKYENKTFQLTADQLTELKKQVGIAQKLAADAFITSKNKVTLRTQYITGTSKDGYKNSLVSFTSVKNNSKGMYSDEDLKVKAIDKAMNKAYNDAVIEFIKAHNDLTLKK